MLKFDIHYHPDLEMKRQIAHWPTYAVACDLEDLRELQHSLGEMTNSIVLIDLEMALIFVGDINWVED